MNEPLVKNGLLLLFLIQFVMAFSMATRTLAPIGQISSIDSVAQELSSPFELGSPTPSHSTASLQNPIYRGIQIIAGFVFSNSRLESHSKLKADYSWKNQIELGTQFARLLLNLLLLALLGWALSCLATPSTPHRLGLLVVLWHVLLSHPASIDWISHSNPTLAVTAFAVAFALRPLMLSRPQFDTALLLMIIATSWLSLFAAPVLWVRRRSNIHLFKTKLRTTMFGLIFLVSLIQLPAFLSFWINSGVPTNLLALSIWFDKITIIAGTITVLLIIGSLLSPASQSTPSHSERLQSLVAFSLPAILMAPLDHPRVDNWICLLPGALLAIGLTQYLQPIAQKSLSIIPRIKPLAAALAAFVFVFFQGFAPPRYAGSTEHYSFCLTTSANFIDLLNKYRGRIPDSPFTYLPMSPRPMKQTFVYPRDLQFGKNQVLVLNRFALLDQLKAKRDAPYHSYRLSADDRQQLKKLLPLIDSVHEQGDLASGYTLIESAACGYQLWSQIPLSLESPED